MRMFPSKETPRDNIIEESRMSMLIRLSSIMGRIQAHINAYQSFNLISNSNPDVSGTDNKVPDLG